jgi:hypothetical protein
MILLLSFFETLSKDNLLVVFSDVFANGNPHWLRKLFKMRRELIVLSSNGRTLEDIFL